MKGVLSHSGKGSCCANFTMNASDQNTEEPSPCVKYLVEEVYYGEKGDNDRMYPFERRTMAVCLK